MNQEKKKPFVKQSVVFLVLYFILFFTPTEKASGQEIFLKLRVVADQANIRLEPDISSIIIRQVPKGTILNATEKKDEWFAVQLTSKQGAVVSGFVHESLVIAIEPLSQEKKPPVIPRIRPVEPEEDQPVSLFRFTLSIMCGGNYVRGGDLNLGIKGLADLYEDTLGIQGEGKIGSVHLGYVLGLEVSFPLSETLSWGFGAEHFQGKNNSQVIYSQRALSSTLHLRPNIRATPLSVFLSFNPVPELYVKGGISFYFAGCSYTYLSETDNMAQQWTGKSHDQGLGLMGGLGYVKKHSANLSFFAEITGRLAKLQGFTGKEDFQDNSGEISTEKGTLYLIQAQVLEERTHPVLFIRETRPNEAGIISAKEAQIDFSGMSIKIGLRFHF
ncbi:MAG: SH3 domain-containing protein [Candidatus Aminicenantes bacterium]|nr:MAG: SH3 domain-containing protein [Candidatus Aminicenantes bacterium]